MWEDSAVIQKQGFPFHISPSKPVPLWVAACGSGVQILSTEIVLVSGLNNPVVWEKQYGYLTEKANENPGEFNKKLVLLTFCSITLLVRKVIPWSM